MKSEVMEHVRKVKTGEVDLESFVEEVAKKTYEIQRKYSPFITIPKIKIPEKKGRLFGIPISIKDNICTKGIQTTAGSKILQGYIPPFNATVVERILEEGAFILGKTAMDEFGFGTFTTNCAYVIPKNPYDPERTCGGSSGGAGCITAAADFPHIAIAESTGGSISCPAAFTGTVGLTPTYGRVSRWGLIDYANSLDRIGCIGKSVCDVALLLSVIAGPDDYDSTVLNLPPEDFTKYCVEDIKGIKIGVPKEYFSEGVDERIKKLVWEQIKLLESYGASYEEISLPHTEYALPAYYIIATAEASTNLAKFCGLRYGLHKELKGNFDDYFSSVRTEGFGEEAKRRIILGTFARIAGFREAYYVKALKVRSKIIEEFKSAFKKFDVLISPTMPILPPKFTEIQNLSPVEVYMTDILTVAPSLAGVPMMSVPIGFIENLPVGMHLIADHLQEGKLIQVAYTFEQVKK